MKTILFDTNFLVEIIKFKINLFSELERVCDFNFEVKVLDKTITELEKINSKESKISLNLIKKKIKIIKTESDKIVDDILLEIAGENTIVATQDKLLKKKLKQKNIKTLIIRQKKYLVII